MATADTAFIADTGRAPVGPGAPGADTAGTPGPEKPEKESLYADHIKIYPRKIQGTWRKVKWATVWVLLGLYYVGPWFRWDRGPNAPDQALLIDMPGRRAYFFFIEIWPQEVYYLTGLLILAAVGLFLSTAWFGRVWCGFTCLQTVWTDLFVWVERLVEGDRNARIRRDKGPLSAGKVGRKLVKHGLWVVISLATGGAWIMYFNDAPTIVGEIFTGQATTTVYGFIGLFSATTYVFAGWAREQLCIYMCPWPRFQAAVFDEHSLIVTYEEWRGEPRGGARKDQSFEDRGHCVNCGLCWQVCPTGVDIRKGQQMACIGCALCVDACNTVMDRFGLPGELITYDSTANQIARSRGEPTKVRLIRPRTLIYMGVLAIVAAVMVFGLASRDRLEINVLHDRAPLFVTLSDGSIRNGYTFKVLNMEREAKTYALSTGGIGSATMTVIGYETKGAATVRLPVKPDDIGSFRVFVKASRSALDGKSTGFDFLLTDTATGETVEHATVFAGPGR